MAEQTRKQPKKTIIKVTYSQKPGFKGKVTAFAFDRAGNLLDRADVKDNTAVLAVSEAKLANGRLFLAPVVEEMGDFTPTVAMMQRLGAYEASVRTRGKLVDAVHIPDPIVDNWLLCRCLVLGRVVKEGSELPICGARVHICEVDRVWRWILQLADTDILRLRDDLLEEIDVREPSHPGPPPVELSRTSPSVSDVITRSRKPEPAARASLSSTTLSKVPPTIVSPLSAEARSALNSTSVQIVRQELVKQVRLIISYLCCWPHWWCLRYDEITVAETDASGRFEAIVFYLCGGDKPDFYFWVEFEIGGVLETIYRPPVACHTYWNYDCGVEVTLHISDDRVPACDTEPDPSGGVVEIVSIGRKVSMSELSGSGSTSANEGLTTSGEPFGGKLEPRVWFSRSELRDGKDIKYYRWSYRRLSLGDGTPLTLPGTWQPLTRTVVRHYAMRTAGGTTHVPYILGPTAVGAETNLFEIKPTELPDGGVEWTIMDEREDLASAHFETYRLGNGADACAKALDAAGKYELKLELFKSTGALVDWTANGIDLQITDDPAPFGTDAVSAATAPDYNRITDAAGHTMAFRMVVRVDNNCCEAKVQPVVGSGLTSGQCGFAEFTPGATTTLTFTAYHPNNFATFNFSVKRGVSVSVLEASASGRTGAPYVVTNDPAPPPHAYILGAASRYSETFAVTTLLEECPRAAFSEALHVWTTAVDGYNRLSHLDSFDHDGFALTPAP